MQKQKKMVWLMSTGLATTGLLAASALSQLAPGTGTGLQGEYFDNPDFTGTKVGRIDPNADFYWTGAPAAGLGVDTWSTRWTAQVQPLYSQTYTFYVHINYSDNVRLWVDDTLIINSWSGDYNPAAELSGQIALVAGQKYNLRLEFRDNAYNAESRLSWSSTSQGKQIVPTTQLYPGPASLTVAPDKQFSASSYVHTPLNPSAVLDSKSATWVADIRRQITQYYGLANVNIEQYSPPVWIVGAGQPTVRVKCWDRSNASWSYQPLQDQWLDVPLPDDFKPSPGTDQEAIVYQPSTGKYWEFWLMQQTGATVTDSAGRAVPEWGARWGGRILSLGTNPGYYPTPGSGAKFGTTATGLPLLAGLITIDEQRAGVINHAVHFALPETRKDVWAFPAQRTDGQLTSVDAIPEGTTFRLPANLDLNALSMDPYARMIARAVQKYGMVLRDRSGSVCFYAENPAGRYVVHPYYGPGGILRCPNGTWEWACAADGNNRLRGFPWDKLQAVQTQLSGPGLTQTATTPSAQTS